jgi:hypothetical protein
MVTKYSPSGLSFVLPRFYNILKRLGNSTNFVGRPTTLPSYETISFLTSGLKEFTCFNTLAKNPSLG